MNALRVLPLLSIASAAFPQDEESWFPLRPGMAWVYSRGGSGDGAGARGAAQPGDEADTRAEYERHRGER
jgi:hypothetical protein